MQLVERIGDDDRVAAGLEYALDLGYVPLVRIQLKPVGHPHVVDELRLGEPGLAQSPFDRLQALLGVDHECAATRSGPIEKRLVEHDRAYELQREGCLALAGVAAEDEPLAT